MNNTTISEGPPRVERQNAIPLEEDLLQEEPIEKNFCVICNIDMGPLNPRQLCGKTYCMNEPEEYMEEDQEEQEQEAGTKKVFES